MPQASHLCVCAVSSSVPTQDNTITTRRRRANVSCCLLLARYFFTDVYSGTPLEFTLGTPFNSTCEKLKLSFGGITLPSP